METGSFHNACTYAAVLSCKIAIYDSSVLLLSSNELSPYIGDWSSWLASAGQCLLSRLFLLISMDESRICE